MTSTDQPRPTEHAENDWEPSEAQWDCPACGDQDAPMSAHTCGGQVRPQHAPSGEPSGVYRIDAKVMAEMVKMDAEQLAEITSLRAELAQRTAERDGYKDQLAQLDQANVTLSGQNTYLGGELNAVWKQRDAYLAELQQTRAVVSAARAYAAIVRKTHGVNVPWAALDAFLQALDHSPAVGEMQNRL